MPVPESGTRARWYRFASSPFIPWVHAQFVIISPPPTLIRLFPRAVKYFLNPVVRYGVITGVGGFKG